VPKKLPDYIKAKAIELRIDRQMSIDEIAERLALPKTTVYYWVNHIPLQRERKPNNPPGRGGPRMNRERAALARDIARTAGVASFAFLCQDPLFRDFVTLYIAEGYKRNRNVVAVANSDPAVIRVATRFMRSFSRRKLVFSVQYHADQDLDELRRFWGDVVAVAPDEIKTQRKSNSNQLAGRTWRSEHGVLTVTANDTEFRARLQGWMDCIRAEWNGEPTPISNLRAA
jgi:transposase-like protein